MKTATPSCLRLLMQRVSRALSFALAIAGRSSDARMAMIAMTTSNSIKVKAIGPVAVLAWGRSRRLGGDCDWKFIGQNLDHRLARRPVAASAGGALPCGDNVPRAARASYLRCC